MRDKPTRRDVTEGLQELRGDRDDPSMATGSVSVEWRGAQPDERPDGMAWDPSDGTLTYDAWSAQQEALDALTEDHDITAFLAGYGAGKSITGARWLIAQAISYPGSRFLAMGIDFQKARDTTFRVLFGQLPGDRTDVVTSSFNGPEQSPIVADYNRQEHRLTFANDSVIKLGSADRWNRYAGDEYGGLWLDEPSHYGEDLHDLLEMLGSRLRGVDGPKRQFWTLTGNGYNAAWTILEKREGADGEPLGLNIELIRASTPDNPYLDENDVERFRRQYAGTGREEQALHGGFEAAQGLVYPQFSRDTHVLEHREARRRVDESNEWRAYCYDAGWRDPRVLLEIGRTAYDQLIVLDEFHESEAHVSDAIDWLEGKPRGVIHAEHNPADIEKFRNAGWPVERAEKSIEPGIAEVRRRLEDDGNDPVDERGGGPIPEPSGTWYEPSSSPGQELIGSKKKVGNLSRGGDDRDADRSDRRGRVGLLVSDQCSNLIQELLSYKEDEVGTSQAVDHCADALRYACMGVRGG